MVIDLAGNETDASEVNPLASVEGELLASMIPLGRTVRLPAVPFDVCTVMYSRWAGRAASGSLAKAGLVPVGWSTDPRRYTTPRTTAQAGLPYLNCRLVPGCQPFSVVSLCHVNPLAVVAAEAAVLPLTMPDKAVSGIATTAAAAARERMVRMELSPVPRRTRCPGVCGHHASRSEVRTSVRSPNPRHRGYPSSAGNYPASVLGRFLKTSHRCPSA